MRLEPQHIDDGENRHLCLLNWYVDILSALLLPRVI